MDSLKTFPNSDAVIAEVLALKPMHRRFLRSALEFLDTEERIESEEYVRSLLGRGYSITEIARAYVVLIEDQFRETVIFRETGNYRFTTFAEAQSHVYMRSQFMTDYMIGLALSSYWWANHTSLRRFFVKNLPRMSNGGLYREIGPGHGLYFAKAIASGRFQAYEGIDVSQASLELTKNTLKIEPTQDGTTINFIHEDFLNVHPEKKANLLVMGEVLEHLENPRLAMHKAFESVLPDGYMFLTTCLNAPAIDHLSNWNSVSALEQDLTSAGFKIEDACILGSAGKDVETCEREKIAINMGYVLKREA